MKYTFQKSNSRADGFTLIEVIVALAIIGIIAVGLFSALGTSFIGTGITDERATAKNLAESQMEYVKQLPWDSTGTTYKLDAETSDQYPGYSATIGPVTTPRVADEDTPWDESDCLNIQKITITVFHHGEEVLQLDGYKLRSTQ